MEMITAGPIPALIQELLKCSVFVTIVFHFHYAFKHLVLWPGPGVETPNAPILHPLLCCFQEAPAVFIKSPCSWTLQPEFVDLRDLSSPEKPLKLPELPRSSDLLRAQVYLCNIKEGRLEFLQHWSFPCAFAIPVQARVRL